MKIKAMLFRLFKLQLRMRFVEMLLVLLLAIILTSGCSGESSNSKGPGSKERPPYKVSTFTVRSNVYPRLITLSGFVEPVSRTSPAARMMARVIEVNVREGDRVQADQILIRLDTRDLLARKRQAKAAVDSASTTLDVAQRNLERMRNLQNSGAVSRHQMETYEVAYAQANAAAAAALAGLDELDVNLSYAVVRAQFSGVIVRKMAEKGNMVVPGQPLFIIEDDSRLRIVAPVGTDLAKGLKPGQILMVRMGGDTIKSTIEGVLSSGSIEAPGLRVQLLIDNPQRCFKTGTLAVVEVPLENTMATNLLIPKVALIEKGRLTGTFVVTKDRTARLHWLILGESSDDMVSVLSGLQEADRVIIFPEKAGVRDGQPVEEINK